MEGSIVKIVLRNFVTYDYCECYPGPQLNMIIGPNGTGKSTIVCAIALGLGGSPQLLGRAKNIAEFVKTGEETASIQIELKQVGQHNVVIQRHINKANNATNWKLNGRSSTYSAVMEIIAKLNIQVDNLCQFLPQDKVAEFAQLTPPLLLTRTQIAVGGKDLVTWHEELTKNRNRQRELEQSRASDLEHLKGLQSRNQSLEKDIGRIKEREKIEKEISLMNAKLPLAKYSDAKNAYDQAKVAEQEAKTKKIQLERDLEPVHKALQEAKTSNEREMREKNTLVEETRELAKQLQNAIEAISKSKQEVNLKEIAIDGRQKQEQRRDEEIKKLENYIAQLEEAVRVEPPSTDPELEKEIKDIISELDNVVIAMKEDEPNFRDLMKQKSEKERQLAGKKQELNALNDIQRVRLDTLQRQHSDTYKAYMWYKDNKTLFKGKIHGPIQLCLNLKNKHYANQVETALGGRDSAHLRTFVCEYREDYKLFMAEMADKQKLRLTAAWPGDINIPSLIQTPFTDAELKAKFGLDHFIINLLDGPPIVLAYLCQQAHINSFPVSLNQVKIENIVEQSPFQRFAIGGNIYRVKKYRYGRGGFQTTVRSIVPAKILTDTVDKEVYAQKVNSLNEVQTTLAAIDAELEMLSTKKREANQKQAELKHKREDKVALRRDIVNQHHIWEGKNRRLQRTRQELAEKSREPAQLAQDIEELKLAIDAEIRRRANLVNNYRRILKTYVSKVMERNVISLKLLSSHGKYEAMKNFTMAQKALMNAAVEEHQQALANVNKSKATARKYFNDANQAGADLIDELKTEFEKICEDWRVNGLDQSQEDIEDAINGLQARMDTMKLVNPLAMTSYEKLMREIKKTESKIATENQELDTLSETINELRQRWESRLNDLVSRISEKFSEALQRIGCAGEVGIAQDEDYSKWGIEIRVKFRDNEKLQLLTGQRQSGGERAVSTILYLMSLQNLARAPFRVVDEINQGMDPRNERMIHEQIVKSASAPGTPQYFLITPKLLPDLYYNDRMRVLCIYNGEWQPEKMKSASDYLRNAKETLAAA
ncbi:uncharacterized protein BX664DRAFT_123673 [Halteromyces radiatus]|uniref:uncharacterized protein n=1 Tax=Halteromyces radiatus TaxID=101107 RepID=UPI002220798B|nr:uncharacterized protein BX664DRAFT_123673 [Halteromyces radiatus]KAI8088924.1 hypothetical protein BX664DRAFT_123673 [Halteromyces radiatus]